MKIQKIMIPALLLVMMLTMACENKQSAGQEWIETDTLGIDKENSRYGICGAETTMNVLQLLTDGGDTLMINIDKALENSRVFGGINVGDQMVVTLVKKGSDTAEQVVNLTSLMGDWVTPNTLDGSGYVGLSFHEGGVLEGIRQTDVDYKSWRIMNGKLLLTCVTKDISEIEQVDTFTFISLGADSLLFSSQGYEYRYGRRSTMSEDYMSIDEDDDYEPESYE